MAREMMLRLREGTDPGVASPAPKSPPARLDWTREISGRSALVIGASWLVALTAIFSTAPAPDPNASISTLGLVMEMGLTTAMFASLAGLAARLAWGGLASLAGGGIIMAMALMCWAGGHTGAWVSVQFLGGASIAGATLLSLNR